MRVVNTLTVSILLIWLAYAHAQERFLIGELSQLQHDVSGTVYALDSRTLQIEGLTYDGLGPAGVFWVDTGSSATSQGRIIPFKETCELNSKLPAYSGDTVTLELPSDLTITDIGYFSIWCRAVAVEFGGVSIPSTIPNLPEVSTASCAPDDDEQQMSEMFPVRDGWNCEPLSAKYQVRWRIDDDDEQQQEGNDSGSGNRNVSIELVSQIEQGEYVGFGPSGESEFTQMVGSDVVIAALVNSSTSEFSIEDYSMTSQSQCSNGVGVCADTRLATNAGINSIFNVNGNHSNGITQFTYTRPLLVEQDDPIDKDISTEGESYITWAIGPFDAGEPNFHPGSTRYPQPGEDGVVRVMIEWGRPASNSCPAFTSSDEGDGDDSDAADSSKDVPGFIRPILSNVTDITARIGPSGGARGIGAITGGTAWGIAWFLSDSQDDDGIGTLIPVLGVERGKTYNFTIYGGSEEYGDTEIHPFYITNSSEGGYIERTPEQRLSERTYAGIDITSQNSSGIYDFNSLGQGALCKLLSPIVNSDNLTWTQYKESINSSCNSNESITSNPGFVSWTVPEDAEDIVYYQCVTHRFLGFKIAVFDEGQVNETQLEDLNGGAELVKQEQEQGETKCEFDSETFTGCELEQFAPLQIYFTVNENDNTIDTLVRLSTEDINEDVEYFSFGWGYDSMVSSSDGNNVLVGLIDEQNETSINMYTLTGRTTSGVVPLSDGLPSELSNTDLQVSDSFISMRFMRPLTSTTSPSIFPPISVTDDTPFIWSLGSRATGAQLQQHSASSSSRGVGSINLASGVTTSGRTTNLPRLQAHGIIMTVIWAFLAPLAILCMRFGKKWNPIAFNIHRVTNTFVVLLTITAFLLALFSSPRDTESNPHRFIGYVIVGLGLLQVIGGIVRPNKDNTSTRKIWYYLHACFGFSTTVLAFVNLFLGVGLGFFMQNINVWRAFIGVGIGIFVILFVILSVLPSKFPLKEEVKSDDAETKGSNAENESNNHI